VPAIGGAACVPHALRDAQRATPSCPCARPARPSPAAGPEGSFSASRSLRVLLVCISSARCEGSPDGLPVRATRRPFVVSGIRCRCPPAQKRAPFVRGCAPDDAGPSHDMGRV